MNNNVNIFGLVVRVHIQQLNMFFSCWDSNYRSLLTDRTTLESIEPIEQADIKPHCPQGPDL